MTDNVADSGQPKVDNSNSNHDSANQEQASPIVQYIVVRTDLGWGPGAQIAQACHASVAAIAQTIETKTTLGYLKDLANMHKVILRAEKLEDLQRVDAKLTEASVAHHLWIEQPENVPSCLACSPQPKHLVQAFFKHFKLLSTFYLKAFDKSWIMYPDFNHVDWAFFFALVSMAGNAFAAHLYYQEVTTLKERMLKMKRLIVATNGRSAQLGENGEGDSLDAVYATRSVNMYNQSQQQDQDNVYPHFTQV